MRRRKKGSVHIAKQHIQLNNSNIYINLGVHHDKGIVHNAEHISNHQKELYEKIIAIKDKEIEYLQKHLKRLEKNEGYFSLWISKLIIYRCSFLSSI